MYRCPNCGAETISLLLKGKALNIDGVPCPQCEYRVRLKYFGLILLIEALLGLAIAIILFPSGFWLVKLFLISVSLALSFVVFHIWPLAIHSWGNKVPLP